MGSPVDELWSWRVVEGVVRKGIGVRPLPVMFFLQNEQREDMF